MQKPFTFLALMMIFCLMVSCKNETQNGEEKNNTTEIAEKPIVKRAEKKDLTPEDIEMLNSLMARIIVEPELKKFASYTVSAGLTDLLSNNAGPFTVFAPSNAALESLTVEKRKFYSSPDNKAKLEEFLKSYIVEGNLEKETLLQTINKNGKANLKTLEGSTLVASKVGEDISITDDKGVKVQVIKGSIASSNGAVYVVNGLLHLN
ncbi:MULTISPECIES: fasciclin domain-containing protein [Aequorivita]|uniref:Fasciclin domain-containing protein n=1 Tax=Aequorivita iocasae TaxID=2803865 RepID=A0ABX7DSY3_9FLAO|nr:MULTISPECIES: fasciclin domain-containing protein [Aequorivita]QQX76930.1 fasciclin domain-containing protein [Aequorivita iocasae]UCA56407.1 fasciclin domain-containing protein [Aequorivita sp. F7]